MSPLQNDYELFLNQDRSFFEQDKLLEELLADCADVEGNEVRTDKIDKKSQKRVEKNKDEPQSSNELKKITHRAIERQRRQEMAALHASLRSLLPPENIKGRRSISDHIHQAMSYIEHMQKQINALQTKRDKLKELLNIQRPAIDMANDPKLSTSADSCNYVKINPCKDGMEILITTSLNGEGFPLSKVLRELVGRGLNVVSCISTRSVDEWFLHKVQIEVNELARINLSELQERLASVIKFA